MSAPRLLITVPEAAESLGISPRTVERYVLSGEIPSIKIGRRRLVVFADLERWVEARKRSAA